MRVDAVLGIIVGLSVIHYSVMGYAGYDPSLEVQGLMNLVLPFMFAWWSLDDAKKRKFHRPYEFGAFIFFAWPIVLPVYLVASRGWKGILIFPVFVIVYNLPWLMGDFAYILS